MKIYLKNPDKYNGVGLTYCDGFPLQKSSQIMASIFSIKPMSLVYGRNKKEFGDRLDMCLPNYELKKTKKNLQPLF